MQAANDPIMPRPAVLPLNEIRVPEPHYPAVGEVPTHRLLTACEALCWIGYRRTIPKSVYFAPLARARRAANPEQLMALPHQSVPDPKPAICPMGAAERLLTEALQSGLLFAFVERNGEFEPVPTEVYDRAVLVNARGSIEPDQGATKRDGQQAERYVANRPPLGNVWFRLLDLLKVWPAPIKAPSPKDFASLRLPQWRRGIDAPGAPVEPREITAAPPLGVPDQRPKATSSAVSQWFRDRVDGWPDEETPPSEKDDWKAATQHFRPGLRRDELRSMRKEYTPSAWRKQGPRLRWGKAKQSSDDPPICGQSAISRPADMDRSSSADTVA